MAYSDEFIRLLRKRAAGNEAAAVKVRSLFFDFLDKVPQDLKWDIFNLFYQDADDDMMLNVPEAEQLSVVIDLFEGEYEEDQLQLTDEQLKYISEGVNDFALELSDETLMNVMKAAVARGVLG